MPCASTRRRPYRRTRCRLLLETLEDRCLLATVAVDAGAGVHAIDPNVYGTAFASTAQLADLNVPLNRDGGNASDTYSYPQDATNHASDYYFESIAAGSGNGQGMDAFVSGAQAGGAKPSITLNLFDWAAKLGAGRSILGSFSVANYGPQQSTDPFAPQWGNGVHTDGTNVTGNNPADAYVANSPASEQAWIQHLIATFGDSQHGGVPYYLLGNEPGLWNSTHRDIHPAGDTLPELRDRIISYATMVKSLDPGAKILGPEEWGWTNYFISGADAAAQNYGATYNGLDAEGWLLDQLRQHDVGTGQRLLDYFTLHFYPQGGQFSNDVSTNMELLRNRSTRSLWDPNYVDESWIGGTGIHGGKVNLINMMKSWVNTYYPGTKIGVTEYNWGAEGNTNGATTQADIWGIFGREGLDLANRWTTPATGTPTYLAMKLYRNYDGNKGAFGDTSVQTTAPTPDQVSAFGALRSGDGALTVMVVNKNLYDPNNSSATTSITIQLSNFTGNGVAQEWQLAAVNPSDQTNAAISHLADVTFSGNSFTVTVPQQSVSLFVLKPAAGSAPAAPTGTSATGGDGQLALSWTAAAGATSYNVYRSTAPGGEGPTAYRTGLTTTGFTDTGLTNGTTYYYQVTAVNNSGESARSAEMSATPRGTTTTTVTTSAAPAVYGQAITFTATVAAAGTPTGTVTFKDGATTLGTGTLSGGTATYTTAALSVATHSITAVYGGAASFAGSTSAALSQTVNQAATAVALGSSANASVSGQPVTFTATVTASAPASGTPTGTVTFKDGANTLGTGTLSGGVAAFTTSGLSVSAHSITAVYGGDANFTGSTSSALSQTVNGAGTAVALGSSANPSSLGQAVTFTATITASPPGSGTPTGTVTFKDGAATLGTGTLSGGVATFTTSGLSVATHSITAVYGGDTNFTGSTSAALSQTVAQMVTGTALASSPAAAVAGQAVTFTATVTAIPLGSGTPTGTVTFEDGSTTLGSAPITGGHSGLTVPGLGVGSHSITAVYGGDANFPGSTSLPLLEVVAKDSTGAVLTVSPATANAGQTVTLTLVVSANLPGSGTPTGTVTFTDGGIALGTVALGGGSAQLSVTNLSAGVHSITAVYGGDGNFIASTGVAVETVVPASPPPPTPSGWKPLPKSVFVTAADAGGGPDVKVLAADGSFLDGLFAFDSKFTGGVRVAVGDVNGDGFPDIICAAGPGGGPNVIVFSGKDRSEIANFFAFDMNFTGGCYVAAGDVNGDGYADIIIGADAGGGPNVTVFKGGPDLSLTRKPDPLLSYFPYDIHFTGGVRVAAGDVKGDGRADIVTGAGPGGGPNVTVYELVNGQPQVLQSYFAFDLHLSAGIFVGAGDVNGDGYADVIAGTGPLNGADTQFVGKPTAAVFSGADASQLARYPAFPMDPTFLGAVRVAATDLSGGGKASVITVHGPTGTPDVDILDGLTGQLLDQFFAYDPNFTGGLYLANTVR